jgi:hypothetical protein
MPKKSSSPHERLKRSPMSAQHRPTGNADRKRQFRETARNILQVAKGKRRLGDAVDTAGAVARAMEQAYRLGFEEALKGRVAAVANPVIAAVEAPNSDAMNWTLIPPRPRSTFWSICLAALGRAGRTETPSYLESAPTRRGTLAWQLVVPDRRTYEKTVGDGTIVTLIRLGLLEDADDETRVVLSDYGIRTWNRFCERGGHWPDDLVEKLP